MPSTPDVFVRRGVRFDLGPRRPDEAAAACAEVIERVAALDAGATDGGGDAGAPGGGAPDGRGVDVVWVGERAGSALGLCAALAARTRRVRIATGVVPLPLHHPLRLAEDAASVDALSNGRLELGLGLGDDDARARAFGRRPRERAAWLDEAVAVLRAAWAPGPLAHRGAFHRFDGLEVHPKPVQPGGPPLWLGARTPAGAERAARLGVGLLTPDTALARRFADAWGRAGRDPAQARVAVELPIVLCEASDARALGRDLPPPYRALASAEALAEVDALARALGPVALDCVLPTEAPGAPAEAIAASLALWAGAPRAGAASIL